MLWMVPRWACTVCTGKLGITFDTFCTALQCKPIVQPFSRVLRHLALSSSANQANGALKLPSSWLALQANPKYRRSLKANIQLVCTVSKCKSSGTWAPVWSPYRRFALRSSANQAPIYFQGSAVFCTALQCKPAMQILLEILPYLALLCSANQPK